MTPSALAHTLPPAVRFRSADCALFQRYANKVGWPAGVEEEDRNHFKSIKSRLLDLFGWLAAEYSGSTELKAYASAINPNAFTPSDLWGCVYPKTVGHQSFALQVALIVRADGAELCLCLGAGWAQVSDAAKKARLAASFAELQKRLLDVPDSILDDLMAAIGSDYRLRKQWRGEPGASEFDVARSWLTYAASPEASGASVSRYLSADELDELGAGIADEMYALLSAVAPLFDFVYGSSLPPVDRLEAALAKFDDTVDEALLDKCRKGWTAGRAAFESTFGTEDKLDELTVEAFFGFLNQIDSHTNAETGLFRLGPGTPAPKRPDTDSWRALDEDLPKLKDALKTLLFGDGSIDARVDRMLALPRPRRYITDDLAVPSMLMCFVDEANHSGINRMTVKKDKLERIGKLPPLPPDATVGVQFAACDSTLRRLPHKYGRDWDWAKTYTFYWSDAFAEFFGNDAIVEHENSAEPDDAALVSLANELYLSDDQFLVRLREMLFEKGQVVLYGPPGTGKTFIANRLMEVLAPNPKQRRVVQFHPSYSYEDFVRGYRPSVSATGGLTYHPEDGPLSILAAQARDDSDNLYVLLIDELNRGNLPRIFGELLYLLEYRDQAIDLMYPNDSGERRFALPSNLLILATMNTADRSIGVVDAALRRRFHFVELAPNVPPLDGLLRRWVQANEPSMLELADWVDKLNEKLAIDFPGKQFQVGHSYFIPVPPIVGPSSPTALDQAKVERIWQNDIEPFLQDQLFGQAQKLSSYKLAAIRKSVAASKQSLREKSLPGEPPDDHDS